MTWTAKRESPKFIHSIPQNTLSYVPVTRLVAPSVICWLCLEYASGRGDGRGAGRGHEWTGEQDEIWECQENVACVRQEQPAADGGKQEATNEAGR